MILKAEITVPDNASWQEIEDKKLKAVWREYHTREERMKMTNLCGKCGGCKHFNQDKGIQGTAYGRCMLKDILKERCTKACKTCYQPIKENK